MNELPDRFFVYRYDRRFALFWRPFGVRVKRDGVRIGRAGFEARYGFLAIRTPLSNVSGVHVTRNYRWWTAMGARLSRKDDGLTFGTNRDAGVCVHFVELVPSRLSRRGHSALTVTVDDLDGLVEVIVAAGGGNGDR